MSDCEKEDNDLSGEQEEGEEEEDDDNSKKEKLENSNENNNDKQQENIIPKTHSYYQSLMSELNNEISILKKNNNNTKKTPIEENYENLQDELNKKKTLLEKLKSTNKKQKISYDILSKRLEEENIRENKIKEKKMNNLELTQQKDSITSEIDKKLDKATKTMKGLRMENQELIKLFYENKDYNKNINLEEKNKEIKEQLQQKNNEKNLLIKQLEQHSSCKEEQKNLEQELNTLKIQYKKITKNIHEIKEKTENSFFGNNKINKSYLTIVSKKLITLNKSTPNIYLNQNKKNNNNYNTLSLPLISSKKNQKEKTILSTEFCNKIKEEFKEDENEYNSLIEKIKIIEKNWYKTEKKNKNEINEQSWKVNSLDEKYKIMKIDNKHSNFNTKMLKIKLLDLSKINKQTHHRFKEVEKELQKVKDIMKNKNAEISKILEQINNIRTLVEFSFIKFEDAEIQKYIEQIKKQRVKKSNGEIKEESKNNINKLSTQNFKSEESIQADFDMPKNNNISESVKSKKKKKKK